MRDDLPNEGSDALAVEEEIVGRGDEFACALEKMRDVPQSSFVFLLRQTPYRPVATA